MKNKPSIEYYQGVWQRELALFTHYSTVRMTVLAFLIPMGGLMIIQEKSWAGVFVILVAWIVNLQFGVRMALKRWLIHRNIDLWLQTDPKENDYERYQQSFPGFKWLITGKVSGKYVFKKPDKKSDDGAWERNWREVLRQAKNTELKLQVLVLFGIVVLLSILFFVY